MRRVFIIAIMFLGITAAQGAQGQTVVQMNGQTNSGEQTSSGGQTGNNQTAAGSVAASPSPSASAASSTSPSGASSESSTATGSAKGSAGGTGSGGSSGSGSGTTSQAPLLLPGEVPETSTQAAATTATVPGSFSPMCPPPVPSTDGGSVNLSEIDGMSLGGC
jgi:hypothetical protein